jgi:hypothetical protein
MSGSAQNLDQAGRPITTFFVPDTTIGEEVHVSKRNTRVESTIHHVATPVVLTKVITGMNTSFSTSHTHGVPRSSLPGTWKEVDTDFPCRAPSKSPKKLRAPRINIIDLTED